MTLTPLRAAGLLLLPALALAACATGDPTPATTPTAATAADEHDHDDEGEHGHGTEVATAHPRLVLAHDGGLLVLDGLTLEEVADVDLEGYNRINGAGDGRHVLVSHTADSPGFHVLDAGTWTQAHGDHGHHFVGDPHLTGEVFAAEAPGHVVAHEGRTVLFDDGTGAFVAFDTAALAEGEVETDAWESEAAHHGVAVELADGTVLSTLGTEDARTGARLLAADGTEITRSEECPGVHGEGVAPGEVVVVGCEDGVLLMRDGAFTKVASPDAFGRIGNQYPSAVSPVSLGDYRDDPEGGISLHAVSLLDTDAATLAVVELPAGVEYTWRGLGRGPAGEALVLGTDGSLHVLEPATGAITRSIPLIDAWEAPEDWQVAHPAMTVLGETAYVIDPAQGQVLAVDLPTGEVYLTGEIPTTAHELVAVSG